MKNYKKISQVLPSSWEKEKGRERSLCLCSCCAESEAFSKPFSSADEEKKFFFETSYIAPLPCFPLPYFLDGTPWSKRWWEEEYVCVGREPPGRDFPLKFLFLYFMSKLRRDRKLGESEETPEASCPVALIRILAASSSQ